MNPPNGSVRARDSILDTHRRFVFHERGEHTENMLAVFRKDAFGPMVGIGGQIVRRTAPNPLIARTDVVHLF